MAMKSAGVAAACNHFTWGITVCGSKRVLMVIQWDKHRRDETKLSWNTPASPAAIAHLAETPFGFCTSAFLHITPQTPKHLGFPVQRIFLFFGGHIFGSSSQD
jgi:hypothetical protein